MASFGYTPFKTLLGQGGLDFREAGSDIRVILVMSNTSADTDQDAQFVNNIGTLDEYDGANYVRKSLAAQAMNEDLPNNRSEFDATDLTWSALGVGTRQCVGAVVYKFVTGDADSPVICYIDTGGFPFSGNGGDVSILWDEQGIAQLT
jgi:hypothetical protein